MNGISHITFIVRDLERMAAFLCQGLGASEVYDSAERNFSLSREKFFVLGGVWIAAMEGEPPDRKSYQHVAFAVDAADFPKYRASLRASTSALLPFARAVFGIEPFAAMTARATATVLTATFALGSAEAIPFGPRSFQLITAAGSLNYSDIGVGLAEISRVLSFGGYFAPYDFSDGRTLRGDKRLAERFASFRDKFPSPLGYALDLAKLPYFANNLRLVAYEEFDVDLTLSAADYVRYMLGDAGVETAIAGGMPEAIARGICESEFCPVFKGQRRPVVFNVELAIAQEDFA